MHLGERAVSIGGEGEILCRARRMQKLTATRGVTLKQTNMVVSTIFPNQSYLHEAISQHIAPLAERTLVGISNKVSYLRAGAGAYEYGGVKITVKEVSRHLESSMLMTLEGSSEDILALVNQAYGEYISYPHLLRDKEVMELRFEGGWLPSQYFPSQPFDAAQYSTQTARQVQRFLEVMHTGRVLGIYGCRGSGRKRLARSLALTLKTHLKVIDRLGMSENVRRMADSMPRSCMLLEDFEDIAGDNTIQLALARFKRMFLNQPGITLFVICNKAEAIKDFPTFDNVRLDLHKIDVADSGLFRQHFGTAEDAERFFEPCLGKAIPQHVLHSFMQEEFDAGDMKYSQRRLEKKCNAWADTGNTMYT